MILISVAMSVSAVLINIILVLLVYIIAKSYQITTIYIVYLGSMIKN